MVSETLAIFIAQVFNGGITQWVWNGYANPESFEELLEDLSPKLSVMLADFQDVIDFDGDDFIADCFDKEGEMLERWQLAFDEFDMAFYEEYE